MTMFYLRNAAIRAAAARSPVSTTTASLTSGARSISNIAKSHQTLARAAAFQASAVPAGRKAFSTSTVPLDTPRPLEPLDETSQPGVAPNPKLESEEALSRARENASSDGQASKGAKTPEWKVIQEERTRSIFVTGMRTSLTDDEIIADFEAFGEIDRIYRGTGTGFWVVIIFKDQSSVQQAVDQANGTFWHGRQIRVQTRKELDKPGHIHRRVKQRDLSPESARLYIGNLPHKTTDAELNEIFNGLDNITEVRVATEPHSSQLKGYAHASFASIEDAKAAMEKLRRIEVQGRWLRLDFAGSRPNSQGYLKKDEEAKTGSDESPSSP